MRMRPADQLRLPAWAANADTLIEPRTVGQPKQRTLVIIPVDNTDAACAELQQHGCSRPLRRTGP